MAARRHYLRPGEAPRRYQADPGLPRLTVIWIAAVVAIFGLLIW